MNKKNLTVLLSAVFLAVIVGFSGIACLATGLNRPVSLWAVALWCLVSGLATGVLCRGKLGLLVPVLLAGVLWLLWQSGILLPGLQGLVYRLTNAYHDAFGWQVVRLGSAAVAAMNRSLPAILCLLGSLVSAVTAWSVAKGQSAVPVVLAALPAPVLSLIVADSTPAMLWVWLLFYGVAMVLITAATRYDDDDRGNRLTLFMAIPVALAVVVLFAAVPKDAYMGQARAKAWSEALFPPAVQEMIDELTGRNIEKAMNNDKRKVSLNTLGLREETNTPMLQVTAGYTGIMYLRSSAYDTYDGISWMSSGDGTTLPWPDINKLQREQETGETTISTRFAHAMLYLPYYTTSMSLHGVGKGISNDKKLNYYSVSCAKIPDKAYFEALYPDKNSTPHTVSQDMKDQCVALPERTNLWAVPLAEEITAGIGNDYYKALAIRDYVKSSARYTLDPERMDSQDKDFARWFLQESNTGYCVHFATAATVLMKAAGIPARYVSGYMFSAKKGVPVTVTDNEAHAWVEYWLPGLGWTVLECTPASSGDSSYVTETEEEGGFSEISVPKGVWWGVAAIVPAGIILQWQIRRRNLKRRLRKGDCRQQVISRWVYLTQLQELLKEPAGADLLELAQKAKFSNHTITNEDVVRFDGAIDEAKGKLRRHNIFKKLYYALILAR